MFNKLIQTFVSRRSFCYLKHIQSTTSVTFCKRLNNYNHRLCMIANFSCNSQVLYKYKDSNKSRAKNVSEDSDDEEDEQINPEEVEGPGTKLLTINAKSLRLDAVVKAGFGISRNKAELAFYESKIRKNGRKVTKKSEYTYEGDEIDLIHSTSSNNPNLIIVSRIKILKATVNNESYKIQITRDKNLLVESKVVDEE